MAVNKHKAEVRRCLPVVVGLFSTHRGCGCALQRLIEMTTLTLDPGCCGGKWPGSQPCKLWRGHNPDGASARLLLAGAELDGSPSMGPSWVWCGIEQALFKPEATKRLCNAPAAALTQEWVMLHVKSRQDLRVQNIQSIQIRTQRATSRDLFSPPSFSKQRLYCKFWQGVWRH